jgi:biotin synthase-like enzyme
MRWLILNRYMIGIAVRVAVDSSVLVGLINPAEYCSYCYFAHRKLVQLTSRWLRSTEPVFAKARRGQIGE